MSKSMGNGKLARAAAVAAGGVLVMATGVGAATAAPNEQEATRAAMAVECGDGNLCVWPETRGGGEPFRYFECLGGPAQPDPPFEVKSWINNQYDGTVAEFWGPGANGALEHKYSSLAPEFDDDSTDPVVTHADPC